MLREREQWYLSEGLIFFHFAVFLMSRADPASQEALALIPSQVWSRPWTLVTFQFIHFGFISFFFSMIVLAIMARTLERDWGSPRFLVFWLISVLGASGTAMVLGQTLAGDIFLSASLLFTFATLYPDTEFLIYFIVPVKVKWLALVAGGYLLLTSFGRGVWLGVANVVGMSAGYCFFLITRKLPSRRQFVHKMKKKRGEFELAAAAETAQQQNLAWDPQVRAAAERARSSGAVAAEDLALVAELEQSRDPEITICAPSEFKFTDDAVCRTCGGFGECAAVHIKLAASGPAQI